MNIVQKRIEIAKRKCNTLTLNGKPGTAKHFMFYLQHHYYQAFSTTIDSYYESLKAGGDAA